MKCSMRYSQSQSASLVISIISIILLILNASIAVIASSSNHNDNNNNNNGMDTSNNINNIIDTNHTYFFISGWPQSGTSLLNQILTMTPFVSTMVTKCDQLIGEKCINWNHEGQWLMEASSNRDKFFNTGSMCRGEYDKDNDNDFQSKQFQEFRGNVLAQWMRFWDNSKHVLVEKSPQSMLKMKLIRHIFAISKDIKYLVVIKHPATLNTAVPADRTWLKEFVRDPLSRKITRSIPLPFEKVLDNFQHFANMLTHDTSKNGTSDSGRTCSIGWIPTMSYLHASLLSDKESTKTVRILRYEDFDHPMLVCQALLKFTFGVNGDGISSSTVGHLFRDVNNAVCERYFSREVLYAQSASTPAIAAASSGGNQIASRSQAMQRTSLLKMRANRGNQVRNLLESSAIEMSPRASKNAVDLNVVDFLNHSVVQQLDGGEYKSTGDYHGRSLRLRDGASSRYRDVEQNQNHQYQTPTPMVQIKKRTEHLDFQPSVVRSARKTRFAEFQDAFRIIKSPSGGKIDLQRGSVVEALKKIEIQLRNYGYGFSDFDTPSSLFDSWDLMKNP